MRRPKQKGEPGPRHCDVDTENPARAQLSVSGGSSGDYETLEYAGPVGLAPIWVRNHMAAARALTATYNTCAQGCLFRATSLEDQRRLVHRARIRPLALF